MFGVSREGVRKLLQKLGIRRRPVAEAARTHTLDHHFFARIDNDVKAYWLGVLLSRGAIYNTAKHGRMVMCPMPLIKRNLLVRFQEVVGSSRPLYRYRSRERVSLIINSGIWIASLHQLGWKEYHNGDRQFLMQKIDPRLHKFVEAGIQAASE